MNIFNYLLYYLIIIPISLLPFPVLYGLSDFLFFIFYSLIGYRKKIVLQNIRNSFPNKTSKEHYETAKKFYHHLCDLIVESLKIFTISQKQVQERMVCKNPEFVNKYFDENRSVVLAGGHYNSWELFAVAIDEFIKHQTIGIYLPLSNKFFDEKMRRTRSKFGLRMISTRIVKQIFEEEKNNLTATIFAIDQSPSKPDNCYWTKFLNQDTAVSIGTEKYAKEYDYPVIFGRVYKPKRGHYILEFEIACEHPKETATGEITRIITEMLEADIIKQPEFWLWSHRRWKL
ncbi:MAG: lysophospholipid acyltransferase family protein, partial [Bacteroidota bacterium]